MSADPKAEAETPEQLHHAYRVACRLRLSEQYARAIPLGAAFNFVLAGVCFAAGNRQASAIMLLIGACFAASWLGLRLPLVRRAPEILILAIAALSALGAATVTGAGEGHGWLIASGILVICWGLGATQLSLSTRGVGFGIALQSLIFLAALHGRYAQWSQGVALLLGLFSSGAMLALVGSKRLHLRDFELFCQERELAARNQELRARQRKLASNHKRLETLVADQVRELLGRGRSIEELEALLAQRVRMRSRSLAERIDRNSLGPAGVNPARASYPDSERGSGVLTRYGLAVSWQSDETSRQVELLSPKLPPGADAQRFSRAVLDSHKHAPDPFLRVLQVLRQNEQLQIVRECTDGLPLVSLLTRGKIGLARGLVIVATVASALAVVHEHGIAHGAIDPSRLWLEGERVVIQDLGMVAAYAASAAEGGTRSVLPWPSHLPPGSSLEHGAVATTEDDVYLLGAILFEICCGLHPQAHEAQQASMEILMPNAPANLLLLLRTMLGPKAGRPSMLDVAATCRGLQEKLGARIAS